MNRNDELLDELYAGTSMSRHAFSVEEMDESLEEGFDMLDEMHHSAEMVQCHFCHCDLHENNNAMTRYFDGKELAARGFGWISVIVEPFQEVPCCDICMDKPETIFMMA
jgi:hypothetical protein